MFNYSKIQSFKLKLRRIYINKIGEDRNLKRLLLSYFKCEKTDKMLKKHKN